MATTSLTVISDIPSNALASCIPIIQKLPPHQCAEPNFEPLEESDGYSSDDTLYDSEDQQHYKYEKVVQARFRPSMPKRTKSAPLPSDDEDSSDDEKPALNQNLRIGRSPYIPVSQHPRSEEAKHAIPKITGPISNFTQCTAIPYRYHHAQKARPIPPPLTHVQPCYAMPYVTYPMYYRIPKHTSNSLFNYTNRSK